MFQLSTGHTLHYILRVASAMCFIGHGAFGIITKAVWCNYFGVFGIGEGSAYSLMPVVGIMDILMGLLILVYPLRIVPAWLVVWGLFTALLRPLSGEHFAEFIERAGNFGIPLVLLMLPGSGVKNFRDLFRTLPSEVVLEERSLARIKFCLQIIVFLVLAGHGWLNIIEKKGLLAQYSSLGFSNPAAVAHAAGIFEVVAAFAILIRPLAPLLIVLLIWKMGTELFYPSYPAFEWIERGGSYAALLALWVTMKRSQRPLFTPSDRVNALGV